jgi:hypothetical protein
MESIDSNDPEFIYSMKWAVLPFLLHRKAEPEHMVQITCYKGDCQKTFLDTFRLRSG